MNDAELESPQLLREMQAELRDALNSLGGRPLEGLLHGYIGYSVGYINRAVEGYIYLRESTRVDASKLLVRPAIEAVFRVQAVRKNPELLFRIAYSEFIDEKKWVRPLDKDAIKLLERHWAQFRQAYHSKYPEHPLSEKKLTAWDASEAAGLKGYYESHYRLYCQFSHGGFRASTGDLNDFEPEDNRTMTLCSFAGIDALVSVGALAPKLPELKRRLGRAVPG